MQISLGGTKQQQNYEIEMFFQRDFSFSVSFTFGRKSTQMPE